MRRGTPTAGALYVYGIARPHVLEGLELRGVGTPPAPIQTVRHRQLAALVSPAPEAVAEGRREDLVAHARALETVVEGAAVLPMRFGMTLPDSTAVVRDLLMAGYERWDALLGAFRDTVELLLRGFHDEGAMLRRVVESSPEVRRLRHVGSLADRLRLGELVASELDDHRQADAAWLLSRLGPRSRSVRQSPTSLAGMVINAAFLVERDAVGAFDREVAALAEEAADRLRLRCLGPQPPYTFVDGGQ